MSIFVLRANKSLKSKVSLISSLSIASHFVRDDSNVACETSVLYYTVLLYTWSQPPAPS